MTNKKWFRLRHKFPWWHWVIHPIRMWKIRKFFKFVEEELHKIADPDLISKALADCAMYGHGSYYVNSNGVYGKSPADLPKIEDIIEEYGEKL